MMTSAPKEKAGFHFPGDGIFHNVVIWAVNLEAATKEYLATRTLIKDATVIAPAKENDTDLQN